MKRFFKVFKRYWIWFVIGIALFIAGIPITIFCKNLAVLGIILLVAGATAVFACYIFTKDRLDAMCSECEKTYSSAGQPVQYEFMLVQKNHKYSTTTATKGQYEGTDYSFAIRITCPHCGTVNNINYKYRSKDEAKAIASCENHIKSLLKIKG